MPYASRPCAQEGDRNHSHQFPLLKSVPAHNLPSLLYKPKAIDTTVSTGCGTARGLQHTRSTSMSQGVPRTYPLAPAQARRRPVHINWLQTTQVLVSFAPKQLKHHPLS